MTGMTAERPLWTELRPLYLTGNKLPPVVAIAAYFDDSKNRDGLIAMGGYLGPVEMWDSQFTPQWERAIKGAPHPIREFKASDCHNGKKEFDLPWTRAERVELTTNLVSVVVDQAVPVLGIGAATKVDYSKATDQKARRKLDRWGYLWCLVSVVRTSLNFAHQFLGDDHIQFVFDEQDDMASRAHKMFPIVLQWIQPHLRDQIRKPHFAPSHLLAPLQAADLLAYETFREVKNRDCEPPIKERTALRRLVEGAPHRAEFLQPEVIWGIHQERKAGKELSASNLVKFPCIYDVSGIVREESFTEQVRGKATS
jgi:hypothetical protein